MFIYFYFQKLVSFFILRQDFLQFFGHQCIQIILIKRTMNYSNFPSNGINKLNCKNKSIAFYILSPKDGGSQIIKCQFQFKPVCVIEIIFITLYY